MVATGQVKIIGADMVAPPVVEKAAPPTTTASNQTEEKTAPPQRLQADKFEAMAKKTEDASTVLQKYWKEELAELRKANGELAEDIQDEAAGGNFDYSA